MVFNYDIQHNISSPSSMIMWENQIPYSIQVGRYGLFTNLFWKQLSLASGTERILQGYITTLQNRFQICLIAVHFQIIMLTLPWKFSIFSISNLSEEVQKLKLKNFHVGIMLHLICYSFLFYIWQLIMIFLFAYLALKIRNPDDESVEMIYKTISQKYHFIVHEYADLKLTKCTRVVPRLDTFCQNLAWYMNFG